MSNPAFPNLLKIGKSKKDPTTDRVNELNQTGVPEPFKVEYYAFVEDEDYLERVVHQKFASERPNKNREFFSVDCVEAIDAIRQLSEVKAKIKYEEVFYVTPEELERFRREREAEIQKQHEQRERQREEQAERERQKQAAAKQQKKQATQDKNNKVIGAWAIGIGLATVVAIIAAIEGAEAEVIWGQFFVWPFLVFLLLEADKPKK